MNPLANFGIEVRSVRDGRNMTQRALAAGTGYDISYVSKIENGVIPPSEQFAARCDEVLQTNGLFARLRARISDVEAPSWFKPYLRLERKADRILDYSVNCLVGFMQTAAYARAILRAGNPGESAEDIEDKVTKRMLRRDSLRHDGGQPAIWIVIHEACLRITVGGRRTMAEQLDHLAAAADHPRTDIQVLPFTAGATAAHILSFTVLKQADGDRTPATMWADGPLGGRMSQTPATVRAAVDAHERLRAHALSPDDSLSMIRAIAEEYR
ncbi:helix-turn-helix domain-containing protein [Streptomyces sp. URMC 129]|uniref:helix-turn-helix domain-containing protein n=1 Tax=Streptomyces sp. URMC 129 TaxID=3423407 RepID=UPI003F1CB0BA